MSSRFDAVIIGGGVIGCSIAYHLAKRRQRVLVLEKNAIGGQTSSVAAGMLAAQEEAKKPDQFFDLCVASRAMFEQFAPEVREISGIDPQYDLCGVWRLALSEEDAAPLKERIAWQAARGWTLKWADPAEVAYALPAIKNGYIGGLYSERDGQVHSDKWIRGLAEAARARGARIHEHVPHVDLVRKGERIVEVRTPTESFTADHVIVAAGSWTGLLMEPLGIPITMKPVKGQVLLLAAYPHVLPAPVFIGTHYYTPKADGHLIIGTTMEDAGFDTRPTLQAQRELAEWAVTWCPELGRREVIGMAAGLRPASADDWPVMGRAPGHENLYICAGHLRSGVLLSPISGKFMADGILDGNWDPLGLPFTPERFVQTAEGKR